MNAEHRPRGNPETGELLAATAVDPNVRQPTDLAPLLVPHLRRYVFVGAPCGCEVNRGAHGCGLELPERTPVCPGRCHASDVATLIHWGIRFGACPCRLGAAS